MELDAARYRKLRAALLGTDLASFARCLTALQFRQPATDPDALQLATELGLVRPGGGGLTETGWFVADSCREYVFWLERDRRLPFEAAAPEVLADVLAGRSVLEIGSGSGINLLSLAGRADEVVGLEPVAIYRQLGAILAEAEGIGPIRLEPGAAEHLPFEDARFDTVLCITAHQYFDIAPALDQIARVLRPSGQLVMISGTLGSYARGCAGALVGRRGLSGLKDYLVTVVNTLGYMSLGRRVLVRASKWSTAYPVYPSRRSMTRMIAQAGLRSVDASRRIGSETCFRARKPSS